MIGDTLGGYRLVQKLGEGSMGEVYLGEHGQSRQKAAVKILFPPFSKEGTALTRYFAEVRSTSLIGHPGIAQVYDCGLHGSGRAYLCMEYLPGRSLAAALGELENVGELTVLANIGGQVAGALQAVHNKRMIHRALKADSVFMTSPSPYPVIKLLDFGLANFTQSVRHSQTGSLLGAPLYMSPEVGRGLGNVDHRADIYSLGCILFEMATGRPPFVREGAGQLIIAHATEVAPAARTLEPSLPPELDDLIARTLRKDPAQRPQTMGEIGAILARLAGGAKAAAPAYVTPTPAPPTPAPSAPAPVFSQMAVPSYPAQVTATPQISIFTTPARAPSAASSAVRAPSAAFSAVRAPSVAPSAANTPAPSKRRPEPTALLQPSARESQALPATPSTRHPTQNSPVARRHEPTALLDPPSKPSVVARPSSKRASRSTPTPVERPTPKARVLSPPLVAIGGGIVVCVAAMVFLLLARKPPAANPEGVSAPSSRAVASGREGFQPPSTVRPPPPEPHPTPDEKLARPLASRDQPTHPAAESSVRPQHSKSHPSNEKSAPARFNKGPRW